MTGPHEIDRNRMAVLDRDECRDLLAGCAVCRFAFCSPEGPTVLPVNHVVDAWTVAFRVSEGSTLTAAVRGDLVAVQADGFDAGTRTGWSVLARGPAEHVTDPEAVTRLDRLDVDTWIDASTAQRWVRVTIDEITGRRLLPPDDPRRG